MAKAAIEKAKQYGDKVLIALLILIGIFYTCLAALPKHGDFYTINYISKSFAAYGFHFLDIMVPKMSSAIAYPPTYYILQGYWIKLGSLIFNYDLSTWAVNSGSAPGVYPFWGMVTNFTCLFVFTAISYFTLKNKWL